MVRVTSGTDHQRQLAKYVAHPRQRQRRVFCSSYRNNTRCRRKRNSQQDGTCLRRCSKHVHISIAVSASVNSRCRGAVHSPGMARLTAHQRCFLGLVPVVRQPPKQRRQKSVRRAKNVGRFCGEPTVSTAGSEPSASIIYEGKRSTTRYGHERKRELRDWTVLFFFSRDDCGPSRALVHQNRCKGPQEVDLCVNSRPA